MEGNWEGWASIQEFGSKGPRGHDVDALPEVRYVRSDCESFERALGTRDPSH